ncbi:hypothetical protein HK405_012269 [Cladochytrium tenue]|nr:hypothetical protein HK405_012269 [Cladochytrium tenue]
MYADDATSAAVRAVPRQLPLSTKTACGKLDASLLDAVDEYVTLQASLADCLAAAFFDLAKARYVMPLHALKSESYDLRMQASTLV